jgi:hypothetical protein
MKEMVFKDGWEVTPDRTKHFEYIKQYFQEGEEPILATKMNRAPTWGAGYAIISNKNFWWLRVTSGFERFIDGLLSTMLRPTDSGQQIDKHHRFDRVVPGTERKLFSLYNIVRIEPLGRGKYRFRWKAFNKRGEPLLDKKGEYKTHKETYRVLPHDKIEKKMGWLDRSEKFGPLLQEIIDSLP